jgi:hypothetical protein
VPHSIEIWRAALYSTDRVLTLAIGSELPSSEAAADPVVELSRIYPALPRAVVEYLAR